MDDAVKHPGHYTYGNIECIDYILDKGLDFPLGNAIKYITRAGHKHSEGRDDKAKAIEDLEKAKQYIDFEIEHRRGEMYCCDGCRAKAKARAKKAKANQGTQKPIISIEAVVAHSLDMSEALGRYVSYAEALQDMER